MSEKLPEWLLWVGIMLCSSYLVALVAELSVGITLDEEPLPY